MLDILEIKMRKSKSSEMMWFRRILCAIGSDGRGNVDAGDMNDCVGKQ